MHTRCSLRAFEPRCLLAAASFQMLLLVAVQPVGPAWAQTAERPSAVEAAASPEPLFHAPVPVRQSRLTRATAPPRQAFTVRTAAHPSRWLGREVSDVRWSPDGGHVYFRWHHEPRPDDDPELDPWYRVDRAGDRVTQVPDGEVHAIPGTDITWSADGRRAAWSRNGAVYLWDESLPGARATRTVYAGSAPARDVRVLPDGRTIHFLVGEDLHALDVAGGSLVQLTQKRVRDHTPRQQWRILEAEQRTLLRQPAVDEARETARANRDRRLDPLTPQPVLVDPGVTVSHVQISPDGKWVTFRATRRPEDRERVQYADYATASGFTEIHHARPKVGEPRDETRLGVVRMDPTVDPADVEVRWVEPREAEGRDVSIHGPYWSLEGDRAVVQTMSMDHKDLWISEFDPASGATTLIAHEHDPAWLGGPPPLAGSLRPGLLEWLPGGHFAFASERTGWSHLYLADRGGTIRPLTFGEWEVRSARLTRDRQLWYITGSREHPSDDHVYLLPASGGVLVRLTDGVGRNHPVPSPDGERLALIHSDNVNLPDLFLSDASAATGSGSGSESPGGGAQRVTASGTDNFYAYPLVRPEIVSFPHPDGDPVWGALFKPEHPNAERAAVLHVHGGGYRQFAHRGWSVYGYEGHLGFIHHLLEQGYTVLDFDYRGSAGFGRAYRTDIYRSMGQKDVDGAVAAAEYLVRVHDIDPTRIGMYGISYGGFFTLMSLFRYPGVFAAGVSDDGVTDWFHYEDIWTSRILNLPGDDPEAYRLSSPIYHAQGLADPLLISHGVIDDNVHFQDAVRLVQRLIELEKDFDVMYYPLERHGFRTETSRYDYYRRVDRHFNEHLLRTRTPRAMRGPG